MAKKKKTRRNEKGGDDRGYIIKVLKANTNTPQFVFPADAVYVGHGNGMTYYNGYLYFAHGEDAKLYRVREEENSTQKQDPLTEWTNGNGTAHYEKKTLSVYGINSGEKIINIAHYSGNYFIVCLKKEYDSSNQTNSLTYGVGLLDGTNFSIQKRFYVKATNTYGAVQDIDYCDGYIWAVLYKSDSSENHIHLIELPDSYSAIEDGTTYGVKKTIAINRNEANRAGTLNELESIYVYKSIFFTWSNIREGWWETFCRYPRFPNGVTVSSIKTKSKTSLEITWKAVSNVDRYRIDRKKEGGTWEKDLDRNIDSSQSTYTDTGLTAGTKYYYRVYGINSSAASPNKNVIFGVTRTITPKVTAITAVSESELKVVWTAVEGAKKYIVCRKKEGTGEGWEYYSRIKEITGTEFLDNNLEPDTEYYYGIIAVTETGVESGNPDEKGNPGSSNRMSGRTLNVKDKEAPVVRGGCLKDISATKCTFEVEATDNVGVDHVEIHTWTGAWTANGDTVYAAVRSGDVWRAEIPLNLTDGQSRIMDVRVYDKAGNQALTSKGETRLSAYVRSTKVTFEANGASQLSEKSRMCLYAGFTDKESATQEGRCIVTHYMSYGDLPIPTRPGHRFMGWYLGENLITKASLICDGNDHTLSAHWEREGTADLGEEFRAVIMNIGTGMVVTNNGSNVSAHRMTGDDNQIWLFKRATIPGRYKIVTSEEALVLQAADGNVAVVEDLEESETDKIQSARWFLYPMEDNWQIYNEAADVCLEVSDGESSEEADIRACDIQKENSNQSFRIIKVYKVSYDGNGGENVPAAQIKLADEAIKLSDQMPERPGFIFVGWSEEASAEKTVYHPGDEYTENRDTVLYAIWQEGEQDLVLPASLEEIGEEAFAGDMVRSVKLPKGLKTIRSKAFADCRNLRTIFIPEETIDIAEDAFEGTEQLTICGKEGSYAEEYAKKNGYRFDKTW